MGAGVQDEGAAVSDATDLATRHCRVDEGLRSAKYTDSRGFLTIGYALNVDAGLGGGRGLASQGSVRAGRGRLRLPVVWAGRHRAAVGAARFDVQHGPDGAEGFHNMLAAVDGRDWETAAAELQIVGMVRSGRPARPAVGAVTPRWRIKPRPKAKSGYRVPRLDAPGDCIRPDRAEHRLLVGLFPAHVRVRPRARSGTSADGELVQDAARVPYSATRDHRVVLVPAFQRTHEEQPK